MFTNRSIRPRARRFVAASAVAVLGAGFFVGMSQHQADAATVKQGCAKFEDEKGFAFFFANEQAVEDLKGIRCSSAQITAAEKLLDLEAPGKSGKGAADLSKGFDFNKSDDDEEEAVDDDFGAETVRNGHIKRECAQFVDDNGFAFFFANAKAEEDLNGTRCSREQIEISKEEFGIDDAPGRAGKGKATLTEDSDFDLGDADADADAE